MVNLKLQRQLETERQDAGFALERKARNAEIDRQITLDNQRKEAVKKLTKMIEGQFSLGRQTKYMKTVREDWDKRPPT